MSARGGRAGDGRFALRIAARRIAAAALLLAVLGAAPAARADEVKLPGTRAVLDVPSGWTPVEDAAARGLVAAYRGARGVVLAVTRAQVPNTDAYRTGAKDAYVEQIERGIAARVKGYRRVARRFGERNGTPTLDLEAKRADGATIVVRVVLFWTYALSLAIEVPPGADAKLAREVAAKFGPPAQAKQAAPANQQAPAKQQPEAAKSPEEAKPPTPAKSRDAAKSPAPAKP